MDHARNSDCVYILIDIGYIPVFEPFLKPDVKNSDNEQKAADLAAFNATR